MMTVLLIQSLGDSCYFGGSALSCLLDQLVTAFGGQALFGLLMGAVIFVAFYIASSGGLATPTVALVLTGTVVISMVPPTYSRIAYGVVLIALGAGVWHGIQHLSEAIR